jgi:hypothetical protein
VALVQALAWTQARALTQMLDLVQVQVRVRVRVRAALP